MAWSKIRLMLGIFFVLLFSLTAYSYTINEALMERDNFNYEAALNILESLPSGPLVDKFKGMEYLRNQKYDNAIEVLTQLHEKDYEIYFGLALAYYLKQDYDNALSYFLKTLEVNKHCAASEYLIGNIKIFQGEKEEALAHYKSALKLDYSLTEAKVIIARLYMVLENHNEAFKTWSHIADIDEKNIEAQESKQELLFLITKTPEEIIPPKRITQASVLVSATDTAGMPHLKIGIVTGAGEVSLWSAGGFTVFEGDKLIYETDSNNVFTVNITSAMFKDTKHLKIKSKSKSTGIIVQNIRYAAGFSWAGISDREFRGTLDILFKPKGLSLINDVNIEEYIYSVLPSEMIAWWPEESLKVQAVITRTQAIYRKNNVSIHGKEGFNLCADQHCQVYKGVKQETPKARKMSDATRGEILVYNGRLVNTLFSSNCSGYTQSSKELKGWGDEPFLSGSYDGEGLPPANPVEFDRWIKHVPDIFCKPSGYTYYAESRWIRVISQEELKGWLNLSYTLGNVKKIIAVERSKSGHINHLSIEGSNGKIELTREHKIRGIILGRLRSTNFIVEGYGNTQDFPDYFVFWGAGWGHAVGLCQSGVAGMVDKGYKYSEILTKYYKGSGIKKLGY